MCVSCFPFPCSHISSGFEKFQSLYPLWQWWVSSIDQLSPCSVTRTFFSFFFFFATTRLPVSLVATYLSDEIRISVLDWGTLLILFPLSSNLPRDSNCSFACLDPLESSFTSCLVVNYLLLF